MRIYRRNGCWLRIFCAALLLTAGCSQPAANHTNSPSDFTLAQSAKSKNQLKKQTDAARPERLWVQAFTADFLDWPDRIIEDSKFTVLKDDNLVALLLAGGASVAMRTSGADDRLDHNFNNHRAFGEFPDRTLDLIGGPGLHFGATGLWYILCAENQDDFNKQRAWTMMTALAITGLSTLSLKAIVNDKTPNGKTWAWPSGHTSSSFAVAAVLDEFYGPNVGIPAYALASLVAYRMMDTGDHWASDIVFGATLGWVVGHTVAGKHKDLEIAGFKVLPCTAFATGPAVGVNLVKRF